MTTYDFFPFVKPSGEGKIVFPDYDTIMKRQEIVTEGSDSEPSTTNQQEELDKLGIDFDKVGKSQGRQKAGVGYSFSELKEIGAKMRDIGYQINFKSKPELIYSIVNPVLNLN